MADAAKGIASEVEGDYGTVKVQIAGGPVGDKVQRPTKGTAHALRHAVLPVHPGSG